MRLEAGVLSGTERITRRGLVTTALFYCFLAIIVIKFLVARNGSGYDFLRRFASLEVAEITVESLCLVFLSVHYLRLFFGLQFMDADETFRAAKLSLPLRVSHRKSLAELVLRTVLVGSIGLFFVMLADFGFGHFLALLAIQATIVGLYDLIFYRELFALDEQRAANLFIFVGDLFFIGCVAYLTCVYWGVLSTAGAALWVTIFLGGYTAVFLGESLSQYLPAVRLSHRDAFYCVKGGFKGWLESVKEVRVDHVDHGWRALPIEGHDRGIRVGGRWVVQEWERPLQAEMGRLAAEGGAARVLEIGYGLGMATSEIQRFETELHLVVEAHPGLSKLAVNHLGAREGRVATCSMWEDLVPLLGRQKFSAIIFDPYPFEMRSFEGTLSNTVRFVAGFLPIGARLLSAGGGLMFLDFSREVHRNDVFVYLAKRHFSKIETHSVEAVAPQGCDYASGNKFHIVRLVRR